MMEKITKLLSSLRFWQITLGAAAVFVAWVEANGFKVSELLNAIGAWLVTIAAIGTVDKAAKNIGTK